MGCGASKPTLDVASIPLDKTTLDLSGDGKRPERWLNEADGELLGDVLRTHEALTTFDVSRNFLYDQGCKPIAEALAKSTSLLHLDLSRLSRNTLTSLADSKRTFVSGHYHSGDSQVRTGEQVWDMTFVLSVHNTPKKVIGCSFCKSS